MTFVLDACTVLSWFFEDEQDDYAESVKASLIAAGAFVPRLWRAEVANGLVKAVRRNRIVPEKILPILDTIAKLPIDVKELDATAAELATLAQKYTITTYDASYLHLAQKENLPLASIDGGLETARKSAGVPRYEPPPSN